MSDTELQFRTATFGGFQKQDVLNYIETSGQEHREKLAELTRQAEETRRENETLRRELDQARQKDQTDGEAARRLEGELAQARKEAEDLRARLTAAEGELSALRADLADARGKLARAEPEAQAYQAVKDRTAGIELDAHCRAQAVQAEAEARAERLREETGQWLEKVRSGYGKLRADMDAAAARARGELEQMNGLLADISKELADQAGHLDRLADSCTAEAGHRPPDPLPLDETPSP